MVQPVIHHTQVDASIRRREIAIAAVRPQVDAHLASMRRERVVSVPRTTRLRDDPARLVQFRERYRASFRKNENDRRVYFARLIETDAVKIGFARFPEKRMKALFDEYGVVAELIGTIPGDHWQEGKLHYVFRRARVYHHRVPELFTYSVIKDAIAALIALQPNVDQMIGLPLPTRLFNNASLDARCVEMAAKRMMPEAS